jgi:hypothetical protein
VANDHANARGEVGNRVMDGLLHPTEAVVDDALRDPGRPLDAVLRAQMEARLGHGLADVRVHSRPPATRAADALGAHGFTLGRHVVLAGDRSPTSAAGRQTLAHELAHVVQQRGAGNVPAHSGARAGGENGPERAAESAAQGGAQPVAGSAATGLMLQADERRRRRPQSKRVRIGPRFKATGKESVEELHQRARAAGYDFTGVPKWTGHNWDVGTATRLPKGTAPKGTAPKGTAPKGTAPPGTEPPGTGPAGKPPPGKAPPGEAPPGGTAKTEGSNAPRKEGGVAGGKGTETGSKGEDGKEKLSDLDWAVKIAGITQFETEEDPEGVSGGIPGGMGPKKNASWLGQLAYLGLAIADVVDFVKVAYSAGKSLVKKGISAIARRFEKKAAAKTAREATKAVVGAKVAKQLKPRGWTEEAVQEAIGSGEQVKAVNKATGNPATRYIHPKTGQSLVVDDVTREVIHVGGPGFKYGPGAGDVP